MSTPPTTQNWFTAREAATYCRISPRTLARWRKAGRIRHYDGRYHRDDLDRAVRNGEPVLEERDVVRTEQTPPVDLLAALQASVDRAKAERTK